MDWPSHIGRTVILIDGACVFCDRLRSFILDHDADGEFYFAHPPPLLDAGYRGLRADALQAFRALRRVPTAGSRLGNRGYSERAASPDMPRSYHPPPPPSPPTTLWHLSNDHASASPWVRALTTTTRRIFKPF